MVSNFLGFFQNDEYILMTLSAIIIFFTLWLLVVGITALLKHDRNKRWGNKVPDC